MGNDAVPHRVLVVDDDVEVRTLVRDGLIIHGFEVSEAGSAAEARRSVAIMRPDVVLLDLTLPDGNGLDLLRELHAGNGVAVIVLSGRGDEADRVAGLELGADDYVTKPFSPREMVARVKALLRRSEPNRGIVAPAIHEAGDVVVDCGRRVTEVAGRPVALAAREFDLLVFLCEHRGLALSRRQLLDGVWGDGWIGDERTVDVHVRQLRKKLGDSFALSTVWSVGYRLD